MKIKLALVITVTASLNCVWWHEPLQDVKNFIKPPALKNMLAQYGGQ